MVCAMPFAAGPKLLREWIARAALRDPEKPWIVCADDGRTVSYRELHEVAGRIAAFLRDRGIGTNDRVALLANNSVEHLLCYFGVMAYGATICTVHVEMNRNQLDNIFARLKPKLVLHQDGLGARRLLAAVSAPRMRLGTLGQARARDILCRGRALRAERRADHGRRGRRRGDPVHLRHQRAAQGRGAELSRAPANIDPAADGFGITADDRLYDFRSFNWASAQLLGALVPVNRGATLVMAAKFSASRFFRHVRDHRVTVAAGNPTTINILLNTETAAHRDNLPTLRFLTSSSAPLTIEEWRRFEERFGIPIAQGLRLERDRLDRGNSRRAAAPRHGRAATGLSPPRDRRCAGRRLPPGEIGQIEIGGFAAHDYRYLADDGSVKVNSRGRIRTGDLGLLDADGFLGLTGREKDLIIRGGVNISPVEIDSFLMQHPELIEVATVGVPDAIYGEEVVSYVVARPGATVDAGELLRYCSDGLPAFKAPKQIVLSPSLPKTERGKLDRRALAQRWSRKRAKAPQRVARLSLP